jgi:hypothetical protein
MNNYLPKLSTDGSLKPTFNPADFDHTDQSVTMADLVDYANLYSANTFF